MKATEYRDTVYRLGVPIRVRELEAELQAYQRDCPELFLSETPIQLLRPELKNGASSNGSGPTTPGAHTRRQTAQRGRTKDLLDWIGAKSFRSADEVRAHGHDMRVIYQLTHHGYLTRKGQIITRTKKAFTVERPSQAAARLVAAPTKTKTTHRTPQKKWYSGATLKQREQSAALIASFDTETPSAPPPESRKAMGALVRRGYLRQRGKGLYVRTHKVYVAQGH